MDPDRIQRSVEWVKVGDHWTRYSVMGTDISPEARRLENMGENDKRTVIVFMPGEAFLIFGIEF